MELKLEKIEKSFGNKTVLKDCSFTFMVREVFLIL